MNRLKRYSGFTIIEVVLVLAIAGLIFLMVFIALPALQREQRNTGYKNNLSVFVAGLQNYKANNRGRNPPVTTSLGGIVIGSSEMDHPIYKYVETLPPDTYVKINAISSSTDGYTIREGDGPRIGRMIAWRDGKCGAPSGPWYGFRIDYAPGKTAAIALLEGGANGIVYCQDF